MSKRKPRRAPKTLEQKVAPTIVKEVADNLDVPTKPVKLHRALGTRSPILPTPVTRRPGLWGWLTSWF
jgi:hypothetical protein